MVGRDHTEVIEKPHGGGEMDFYRGEKFSFFFFFILILLVFIYLFLWAQSSFSLISSIETLKGLFPLKTYKTLRRLK